MGTKGQSRCVKNIIPQVLESSFDEGLLLTALRSQPPSEDLFKAFFLLFKSMQISHFLTVDLQIEYLQTIQKKYFFSIKADFSKLLCYKASASRGGSRERFPEQPQQVWQTNLLFAPLRAEGPLTNKTYIAPTTSRQQTLLGWTGGWSTAGSIHIGSL